MGESSRGGVRCVPTYLLPHEFVDDPSPLYQSSLAMVARHETAGSNESSSERQLGIDAHPKCITWVLVQDSSELFDAWHAGSVP